MATGCADLWLLFVGLVFRSGWEEYLLEGTPTPPRLIIPPASGPPNLDTETLPCMKKDPQPAHPAVRKSGATATVPARTPPRYAPAIPLPPYAYIPGHGLPHPVNDPSGHLYAQNDQVHERPIPFDVLANVPADPVSRRRAIAPLLAADSRWLYAIDLFNGGWYWESHEAWESFWNALGRTTPEALFVQGLIHLAAACVKVREGKPNGVARHTRRARELVGDHNASVGGALSLAPESVTAVVAELERWKPACWHTTPAPVVRVLDESLWLDG